MRAQYRTPVHTRSVRIVGPIRRAGENARRAHHHDCPTRCDYDSTTAILIPTTSAQKKAVRKGNEGVSGDKVTP
jgi:hypothetical protein